MNPQHHPCKSCGADVRLLHEPPPADVECWPCQKAGLVVVPKEWFPRDDYDGGLGSGDWIAAEEEAKRDANGALRAVFVEGGEDDA